MMALAPAIRRPDPAPSGAEPLVLDALARWPHLPAFWPGHEGPLPPFGLAPFAPPCFAGRDAPPLIVTEDEVPLAPGEAEVLAGIIARARLGGPPDLPDPGAAALGLARDMAVVLDPCDPARRVTAEAALATARRSGRPVLLARDPFAHRSATPVLPAAPGLRRVPQPLSPWTLLDAATSLHGATPFMAALAEAAGVPHDLAGAHLVPLLARIRAADPFRRRPWSRAEGFALLADWMTAERSNRRISVCIGIARWKRRQVSAVLAHGGGAPAFTHDIARAIERARAEGGAVVAWAAACPDGLAAVIRRQGVELRLLEDGFVRSRGLGARFLPGASYSLDSRGAYYDPRQPSDLEAMLAKGGYDAALLARSAALRGEIVRRGVSKYNLTSQAALPDIPAGRRVVLVPGQVEDDASVRLGGGAIRSNLALLKAVRAAEPEAFILYKPHPDLEAGFRRGRLRPADLAGLADAVVGGVPLPALLPKVDALHTLTSLSGFEALLRGLAVTCWGQPFYAGWGLTEDRAPLPEGRRGMARTLDELVAAALILYPRYVDPVTLLPCPPEVMLDRLEDPAVWRISPLTIHRGVEGFVRGALARIGGRR
ncbi:capsular polysaccharide export protein, LipB/KpsS family [Roseomonas sp. WA12]